MAGEALATLVAVAVAVAVLHPAQVAEAQSWKTPAGPGQHVSGSACLNDVGSP